MRQLAYRLGRILGNLGSRPSFPVSQAIAKVSEREEGRIFLRGVRNPWTWGLATLGAFVWMAASPGGDHPLAGLIVFASAVNWILTRAGADGSATRNREWRRIQLAQVDAMTGHQFEHYVALLMRNEGFVNVEVTPASGDFGVDIIANRAGVKFAVQVKRYSKNVDRSAVSDAVAGVKAYGCARAMVITNRFLTKAAREYATRTACEVVDRNALALWIDRFKVDSGAQPGANALETRTALVAPIQRSAARAPAQASGDSGEATLPRQARQLPPDVLAAVLKRQKELHPRDHEIQMFAVEEEVRDWLALQKLQPAGVPEEVFRTIRDTAERFNPGDYSIQLSAVSDDIEAYLELQNLKAPDVPGDVLRNMCARAEELNPGDYSTQLFGIRREIESERSIRALS